MIFEKRSFKSGDRVVLSLPKDPIEFIKIENETFGTDNIRVGSYFTSLTDICLKNKNITYIIDEVFLVGSGHVKYKLNPSIGYYVPEEFLRRASRQLELDFGE